MSVGQDINWHADSCKQHVLYSRTTFTRINWDSETSGYVEISDNWIFLGKYATLAVLSGKKISTNGCFRLHIYWRTNKTLIHNSLHVFENWGRNLNYKNISYNHSKKRFIRRAKPIWITGDPDNQRPNKRSSAETIVVCSNFLINIL